MIDKLPEDLTVKILDKLPIKTTGQCILVSHSWRSQIKHLNYISPNSHFLLFRTSSDQFSLHSDNDKFNLYKHLNLPFRDENRNFRDCGTCNGLICLVKEDDSAIVLWNPTIKRTLTLPEPNLTDSPYKVFHGFGYDSSTKDYKLVRILRYIEASSTEDKDYKLVTKAEVFSLQRKSWEILAPESLTTIDTKCDIVQAGPQAFVNGVLHWIGRIRGTADSPLLPCQIVGFDMRGGEFQEIRLPEGMDDRSRYEMTIFVHEESSIGVCFHDSTNRERLEAWVMTVYGNVQSWTKIWTVDRQRRQLQATLGFRNNGEVILEEHGYIILVDVESNKGKAVEMRDHAFSRCPVSYYVESLVLLDNHNAVSYTIVPADANISSDANHDIDANDASNDEPMDIDDSSGADSNGDASDAYDRLCLEWFLQDCLES